MGSAEDISSTLRDRGHQRLWLVVSIVWVLIAGWFFWKPFAQYQPVDVSRQVSDWCEAEESAELYATGEKAYQTCLEERRKTSNSQSPIPGLTSEAICDLQRQVAGSKRDAADAAESKCADDNYGPTAQRMQPEADRAVDQSRINDLIVWGAIVFLPPVLLPLGIILLLYSVLLIGKWIMEGYNRPQQ